MRTRLQVTIFSMATALAILLSHKSVYAEETVEIPLSEIWALNMPGTREVSTPEDKEGPFGRRPLDVMQHAILSKPPERAARKAFVVPGSGLRALGLAKKEFVTKSRHYEQPGTLTTEHETSLVFFAHPLAYHVHLERVERRGMEINVQYQLVPHFTGESAIHYAVIPLGHLPAGEYRVNIIESPLEQKHRDAGFQPLSEEQTKRTISQPFSFVVVELPNPDPQPAEGEVVIPLEEIWAWEMPGTKDVRELESEQLEKIAKSLTAKEFEENFNNSTIHRLGQFLQLKSATDAEGNHTTRPPGKAFAVQGIDETALLEAHSVLAGEKEPKSSFPAGSKLSLVFHSLAAGSPVQLTSVMQQGHKISVRFKFGVRFTSHASSHFALIPLPQMEPGEIEVEIVQEPVDEPNLDDSGPKVYLDWQDRVICKPFSFTIKKED